jgi:shikimate dehydrogenase
MPHPDRFLLAGVMGWPVMHSRSPMLHNYWFSHYGLAGSYVPLAIPPERLHAALAALAPLGFAGCNLTIPHKQTAIPAMAEIDAVAKAIGAISCVTVRPDGSLVGSNNDCFGFIANLLEAQPDWRADAGPAIVIGAGGGARAVVYGLAEQGAREIRLTNRTRGRAETIATEFGGPIQVLDWDDRHAALDGAATLVNTTSLGMVGQPPLDLSLERLPADALVSDIIYTPLETSLLAEARRRGNPTVNGLGMLLHQARPAWRDWFGIEPEVTPELRRMIEATL